MRLRWAVSLGWCLCTAAASAGSFEEGVAEYRKGRTAMAYGHFVDAANAGDADAARFALFLMRYGPLLHGSHWSATPDEAALWTALAQSRQGRPPPVFEPAQAGSRAAPVQRIRRIQCQLPVAPNWPTDC